MILIAHRGNTVGPNPDSENRPEHIDKALAAGYDAEIDVWFKHGTFWLGHDEPQYAVQSDYLENERLWCHAKNLEGLEKMLANRKIHCFWHQEDDVQLTSKGYIWTYPNKQYGSMSICVLPDSPEQIQGAAGVCLDDFSLLNDKTYGRKK